MSPFNQQKTYSYLMHIAYDGSAFQGWQSQPNRKTIQDHIEQALKILLKSPVRLIGASRTDAGVHALGQIACFQSPTPIEPLEAFRYSLESILPTSIGIAEIMPCRHDFHPIRDVHYKRYLYRIWLGHFRHPLYLSTAWWPKKRNLDINLMQQGASYLIGKHDFSAFCASDSHAKTKVRHLISLKISQAEDQLLNLEFMGKGFLKHMIRNIVGTLYEIGQKNLLCQEIPRILASKDRRLAGITAPAHGLCLMEVAFDRNKAIIP